MHISLASILTFLGVVSSISYNSVHAASILYKRDSSMECPTNPGGAGTYPDSGDCSRYFYCTAGTRDPIVGYCPAGTLYSSSMRRCVVSSRADCH